MKEFWLKLKEWWANLASREKQAVMLGGTLAGVAILYLWLWAPLMEAMTSERNRIPSDQRQLAWMKNADTEIKKIENQGTNKAPLLSPVALLSYLQTKVKNAELESYVTQLKQISNENITMHFQKVEFDKMVNLLIAITKEQNVSVSQLSVMAEKTPGFVTADVMVKLG